MRFTRSKVAGILVIGVIGIVLSGIVVGCSSPAFIPPVDNTTDTPVIPVTPAVVDDTATGGINETYEAANVNNTWHCPGEITMTITPAELGVSSTIAGYNIRIHNGEDIPVTFSITIISSDFSEGYETLPVEYYNWVNISNPNPYILAKETKVVWIGFDIPAGDKNSPWIGKNYEVRTQYKPSSGGMVGTATTTRWQIKLV